MIRLILASPPGFVVGLAIGGIDSVGGRIANRIDAEKSLRVFAAALVALALFTAATAVAGMI